MELNPLGLQDKTTLQAQTTASVATQEQLLSSTEDKTTSLKSHIKHDLKISIPGKQIPLEIGTLDFQIEDFEKMVKILPESATKPELEEFMRGPSNHSLFFQTYKNCYMFLLKIIKDKQNYVLEIDFASTKDFPLIHNITLYHEKNDSLYYTEFSIAELTRIINMENLTNLFTFLNELVNSHSTLFPPKKNSETKKNSQSENWILRKSLQNSYYTVAMAKDRTYYWTRIHSPGTNSNSDNRFDWKKIMDTIDKIKKHIETESSPKNLIDDD